MLLVADVSLRDERPPKRRRIDEANKQDQPSVTVWCSPTTSSSVPSCSVCNQSLVRSTSCPSCHTLVCSSRCTAICDATIRTQPQAPTPPLLSDEESVGGSSPSTPVRYSTPEPFDPQILRARLNAAAAASASATNSFQPSSNPISSWHSDHMQLDHYQPTNPNASLTSGQSNALSIGNSTSTSNSNGNSYSNLHKKRKRKSYCTSISSSSTSSFNADLSASAVEAINSNGLPAVSRQPLDQFCRHQVPSLALEALPSVAEIGHSLSALSAAQSSGNGHGCSVRLCLNCLVTTSDGHKICFSCLEDSFAC